MNAHQLTVDAALKSLRSRAEGLSSGEASLRLVEFGPNRIERATQRPIALRHLERGKPTREHIHSVVRTPNGNDYGKDLLRQHYAERRH